MTDSAAMTMAQAAWFMLAECIKDACGEDVMMPAWVAGHLKEEHDRMREELDSYYEALARADRKHDELCAEIARLRLGVE